MKYAVIAVAVAAGWYAVSSPGSAPSHRAQDDRWTWRGRVAAGKTLEVRGVNGSVSAEPATGAEVEVVAEKHGRRDDPNEVRIEVVEHDDGVTICAVYPGRRNRCVPGGGEMSVRENDVEVDFTVRVPRGVAFYGANVNGAVEATDLAGSVELETVNGGVRLETSGGDARARTVNGGINAVIRGSAGQRPLRFETVNGGITLTLPRDINADVEARSVNGSITPDFPITVSGRLRRNRLSGRIGQGGRLLQVETVNGSIRLRQAT